MHRKEINSIWDLNCLPWPWNDEQFEWIEAWAVLEHLKPNLLDTVNECWRLLVPGGTLKVKVPWAGNLQAWDDPTHVRPYTQTSFDFFDPSTEMGRRAGWYTDRKWRIDFNQINPEKTSVMVRMRKRPRGE